MVTEVQIECPFCGETYTAVVDCSVDTQEYVEDCFVCCRPITFQIEAQDGELIRVEVSRE